MRCAVDQEQLFVLRAGGQLVGTFGHVQRVGFRTGHHEQRLIDEIHIALRIKAH
ncbi:hypothetical protein D1872_354460 [compost metagenome]